MERNDIIENLTNAVVDGDQDKAQTGAKEALKQKMNPLEVIDQGLSMGAEIVGDRFERGEAFLPELLKAADAFDAAMEILKPQIEAEGAEKNKIGTVLIATVKGDIHNIGKNIVATILNTRGFSVVDIGINVSTLTIIEEAEKAKADIIALSSVMTTTMPFQREIIEALNDMNLRDKYLVIVGGGPVNQEWADAIGADGYGETAIGAVDLAKKLLNKKNNLY